MDDDGIFGKLENGGNWTCKAMTYLLSWPWGFCWPTKVTGAKAQTTIVWMSESLEFSRQKPWPQKGKIHGAKRAQIHQKRPKNVVKRDFTFSKQNILEHPVSDASVCPHPLEDFVWNRGFGIVKKNGGCIFWFSDFLLEEEAHSVWKSLKKSHFAALRRATFVNNIRIFAPKINNWTRCNFDHFGMNQSFFRIKSRKVCGN